MAKSKGKTEFERQLARNLLDMIVADKKIRIHLEARLEHVPTAGDFRSVQLRDCKRNQAFLDWLVANCETIWDAIEKTEKQGDILDKPAKEKRLKDKLLGREDPEAGAVEPLGATPAAL